MYQIFDLGEYDATTAGPVGRPGWIAGKTIQEQTRDKVARASRHVQEQTDKLVRLCGPQHIQIYENKYFDNFRKSILIFVGLFS